MEERISVLIADDNKVFADGVKEFLRTKAEFGAIYVAYDGEEAYQMIMDEKPDLVLLDIIMPKRDGISVLKKISASHLAKDC